MSCGRCTLGSNLSKSRALIKKYKRVVSIESPFLRKCFKTLLTISLVCMVTEGYFYRLV